MQLFEISDDLKRSLTIPVSMDMNRLESASARFSKSSGFHPSYGTAGFRAEGGQLHSTIFRCMQDCSYMAHQDWSKFFHLLGEGQWYKCLQSILVRETSFTSPNYAHKNRKLCLYAPSCSIQKGSFLVLQMRHSYGLAVLQNSRYNWNCCDGFAQSC